MNNFNNSLSAFGLRVANAQETAKYAFAHGIPLSNYGLSGKIVKRAGGRTRKQNPAVPGMSDIINQPLYDNTVTVAAAGTTGTNYTAFTAVQAGNILTTNMETPSALPRSFSYNATSLRVVIQSDIPGINALLYAFTVNFRISGKYYAQGPAFLFPAGCGVTGMAATTVAATTLSAASNGLPIVGNAFDLRIPGGFKLGRVQDPDGNMVELLSDGNTGVSILDGQNFGVDINFPTAVTLPAGSSAKIWIVLDGQLTRIVS